MKYQYLVVAIVAIAVVAIGVYVVFSAGTQVVVSGDNVSVYYTGSFSNGTVFQSDFGGQPLNFIVGANQVIPGFNNAVIGMMLNQTKNVTIPVNEAYGQVNPNLFVSVPVNAFGNQTIKIGQTVLEKIPNGGQVTGIVTKVNTSNVTVDFNPPLAGHTLIFTIKIIGIKKSSS